MATGPSPSPAPSSAPEPLDRETVIVSLVVLLGAVMSILDTTIVNVAIDRLASDFDTSLTHIQWVVTGYTLALATVIPITGWASDRFGTKRVYLSSLVLFMLGSALSGLAWSAESLIGFRILQGAGGGMLMPVVMTILTKQAGPDRMGRIMGILGVPLLLAPILGPILGGWLVDDVSWRWIFFVNVPVGIVAFFSARVVLAPDEPRPGDPLDWTGLVLLSPGLALLIYGLAESPDDGFGAFEAWGPIVAGVALIAGFFRHAWTAEHPLIDIRTFVGSRAGAAALAFLMFSIAFFGALLLLPLYYQTVRGDSAFRAGLLMAPQGIGAMITMPIAGKLTDRHGPMKLPALGIPVVILGMLPFAFITQDTPYLLLAASTFVIGLGMGFSMMPIMTASLQSVPDRAVASTSSAMNIIRQAGASIGTAVVSVILSHYMQAKFGAGGGEGSLSGIHGMTDAERARIDGPLADAFGSTYVWAIALLLVSFVAALGMAFYRDRRRSTPQPASIMPELQHDTRTEDRNLRGTGLAG